MLPLNPKTLASAVMQSAGMTPQSAARRYWAHRFKTGGPRLHKPGIGQAKSDCDDECNMARPPASYRDGQVVFEADHDTGRIAPHMPQGDEQSEGNAYERMDLPFGQEEESEDGGQQDPA
jgi:hypothetical protein